MKPQARLLAHLVASSPWAILETDPTWTTLQELATGSIAVDLDQEAFDERMSAASFRERMGAVKAGTVQIIPVQGILTQHYSWLTWLMDGTALDWLREAIFEAISDVEVTAIVLDVDSPGGSVDGLTEFSAELRALRDNGGKPIVAVASPRIASAAYWTMSQANEIVITPSGAVGSIGIVAMHRDFSRALDTQGITVTLIYSGTYKTEGNPFEPLGEEALKEFQFESDHYYTMFLADVAKGRNTTAALVGETFGQARMVFPQPALAAGMVDRIDTLENTVRRLARGRAAAGRARAEAVDGGPTASTLEDLELVIPPRRARVPIPIATADSEPIVPAAEAEDASTEADPDATVEADEPRETPEDEAQTEPDPEPAAEPAPTPISSRRRDRAWVAANAAAFDRAAQNTAAPRWFERSQSR